VGARSTFSRAVWFGFGAALAVPLACGGKSTTLESENAAGEGTGGSGSGRGGSGGATTGSGATGGTGMGATGGSTAGTGGAGATAGAGGPAAGAGGIDACQTIGLDERRCLSDSDCELSARPICCGDEPIRGVSRASNCAQDPVACVARCARPRWITDTNEITVDLGVVQVRCEFTEPDVGACTSYIDLDAPPPPTHCNGVLCAPTEVCVHYAPPGGPVPPCTPLGDGGTCDPDSQEGVCPDTGVKGCIPVRLPRCVSAGPSCGRPIDCQCLPQDICGGIATACTDVKLRDVYCVDESP
jgi:hypothetical protein